MSLGQIIRKKREKLKLTLDEVSKRVGYSKPYLSTIENSKVKNPPGDELLVKLEQILDFEPGLLVHIAHMQKIPGDVRQNFESAAAENQRLRTFIKNLINSGSMNSDLNKFIEESEWAQQGGENLPAAGFVPVINKVSAGYPVDFSDLDYPVGVADDYVKCPDLHDPNAFAVRVFGDSMEPRFHEGDIVVFSPAAEVKNGDDCFVRFSSPHECTFKRVFFEQDGRVRLQPRNEKYMPIMTETERINGMYKAVVRYEKL